jgi:hypothetical protein
MAGSPLGSLDTVALGAARRCPRFTAALLVAVESTDLKPLG